MTARFIEARKTNVAALSRATGVARNTIAKYRDEGDEPLVWLLALRTLSLGLPPYGQALPE